MKTKALAKFMAYMLGRDPSEFGLVPDNNNRYKIKDVLKAINEMDGYRNIRLGDLKELTLTLEKPVIIMEEGFISAADTTVLITKRLAENPPKILYTPVRGKAHAHILREGILPTGAPYVLMSPDKDMAMRIGRRIDSEPVIVEVRTHVCMEEGVIIREAGQLFIADYLPSKCFSAPPLPKEPVAKTKPHKSKARPETPSPPLNPGSFFMDLHEETVSHEEKLRRAQKEKQIKKERQQARRQKQQRNTNDEY